MFAFLAVSALYFAAVSYDNNSVRQMNIDNQNQVLREQQHLQMLYDKLQQAHQQKYKIMETQECFANTCPTTPDSLQDADNNIQSAQQQYLQYLHSPKTIPTHCQLIPHGRRRQLQCNTLSNNNTINNTDNNTFQIRDLQSLFTTLLFVAFVVIISIHMYSLNHRS